MDDNWTSFKPRSAAEGSVAVCVKCGSEIVKAIQVTVKERGIFSTRKVQRDFDCCEGCGRAVGWDGPEPSRTAGIQIKRRLANGSDVVVWPPKG